MSLADVLADPDGDWVYVVDVYLQSGNQGWSWGRVVSPRFGETTRQFPPKLRNPLNLQTAISPLGLGTGAGTTIGTIDIAWEFDDGLDGLAYEIWDGNAVGVFLGRATDSFTTLQGQPVFVGYTEDVIFDGATLSIVLRTPGSALDAPLQTNLYAGTGTTDAGTTGVPGDDLYEGGAALTDVPKPIALGAPRNVTPIKIDDEAGTQWRIYQFHDGVAKAVDAVYDKGVALVSDGDTSDLFAWTPVAGKFKTDLSRGLFRLGSTPTGLVTADVQGVNDDADCTFPTLAAEHCRWIAKRMGLGSGDINAASVTQLLSDATGPLSYYSGPATESAIAVIRNVLESIGGYVYFNGIGEMVVGQMRYRTPSLEISNERGQGLIRSVRRLRSPLPVWRQKLGYARNWTVQNDDALAGGVTAARRAVVSKQFQYASSTDATLLSTHPLARDESRDTLFDSSAAAGGEASRQRQLMIGTRFTYELDLSGLQFLIEPGETITLTYPRFGLDGGVDMFVLGVSENAAQRSTTLLVYG